MDNYVKSISQGGGAAPAAGNPSMGGGNVPFAPGVISGNLGGGQAPLARNTVNPMHQQPVPEAPPPPAPTGAAPAPGAAPQPGGMPQPNMQVWAAFYLQFLDSYMQAIKKSADKPLIGGMY